MTVDLHQAVSDYVTLRRALGYQLRGYERYLADLVADVEHGGAETLTIEAAAAWATKPADVLPLQWKTRLGIARGFARYVQTLDAATEVPPSNLLAFRRRSRPAPYLYSPDEIQALLDATDVLTPLRAVTYRTMLGLLAVTGMRVGEAIALDRCDVELRECRLVIHDGKGGGRRLPLHPSTAEALEAYTRVRDRLFPAPTAPSFFVSTTGTRLIYERFRTTFTKLRSTAGLDSRRPLPRAHDLRHGFAVQTLLDWHRADLDVAARLPLLGTWMGHRHPASTYYYLQAAPELLALAAQRVPDLGTWS
jgi:integrase/recombinase XerD